MPMNSLNVNTDSKCTCIFMCSSLYKKYNSDIFLLNVVCNNYLYNRRNRKRERKEKREEPTKEKKRKKPRMYEEEEEDRPRERLREREREH